MDDNGQMSIFDYGEEEKMCSNCKHSVQRSDFDIMANGKWAWRFICTLINDYKQTCSCCSKWENGDEKVPIHESN